MALVVKDRVQETSSTTGTGTLTLDGAVSGFQTFSSAVGNGNTTYYAIVGGADWEVGIGTVGAGTLSRDTILESSNSGSAVNFSAGSKAVFVTYPAEKSVDTDTAQNLTNKTIDSSPIGATTPSTGKFTSVTTPSVTATTNDLTLSAISTGSVIVNQGTNGATGLVLSNSALSTASARLFFQNSNGTTSISNVAGNTMEFRTSATIGTTSGAEQFRVSNTASAVNYVQVTGSATTVTPVVSSQGSDANIALSFQSKGSGAINFFNNGGITSRQVRIDGGSVAVNYLDLYGSATNLEPSIRVNGSDTNISLALQSKGTGSIDLASGSTGVNVSNGTTVTAITRTAVGANYTSAPAVAISAPNIAGGVQATATCSIGVATFAVAGGGTGYSVNDVLTMVGGTFTTAATCTVTAVSGGVITAVSATSTGTYSVAPTNPVSVTGGTGTGATLNLTFGVLSTFTITNAGSGYTSQPTVTFSGGGGSGASAYATVGSGTVIRSLGSTGTQSLSFFTPSGEALRIRDTGSSGAYVMVNTTSTGTSLVAQGTANAFFGINSNGTSAIDFGTNGNTGNTQLRVSHTASAVNYVQVTGAATTGSPVISVQGSDTNIPFNAWTKGNQAFNFLTNGGAQRQFRITHTTNAVNFGYVTGSAAGNAVTFGVDALSSDTNIDLTLTPKGTGKVVITNGLQGGTF